MSTEVANVANPFGKQMAAAGNNAMAVAEVERAIQEVQAAMVIAKKFPRDQIKAMDRIINACTRPTLAQTALYCYPRGGQEVTGPSIRLAEVLAQEWGNIHFGVRELSAENGVSTVETFAYDVENNVRQVKVFQVAHTRYAKGQLNKLTDPRDIYEMIANQGARRLRACILGVIPGDVIEAAERQCEITQEANIDVTPETIKKMLDAFEKEYGVTQQLIEKRIGKRADAINASQLLNLRKIFQSLRDGMSKASDWFDIESNDTPVEPKVSEFNKDLKQKRAAKETKPAEAPAPAVDTSDIELSLATAMNLDELAEAADLIRSVEDEAAKARLNDLYTQREAALKQ